MNYGGLKNNFASLIFLVMILSLVLTEAGEDPNDKGPDLISHLNLIITLLTSERSGAVIHVIRVERALTGSNALF